MPGSEFRGDQEGVPVTEDVIGVGVPSPVAVGDRVALEQDARACGEGRDIRRG
jgi:hypothetical protein